jgi:hypothetical protein
MDPFSERYGYTKRKSIQIHSLDSELRNSLWNVCRTFLFHSGKRNTTIVLKDSDLYRVAYLLYVNFFKTPADELPHYIHDFIKSQLQFFQNGEWYSVLNYLEFVANNYLEDAFRDRFIVAINSELEEEKSAYRFVGYALAPISNDTEISEIERSLDQPERFASVSKHIEDAVALYARKPIPDYRNTIKEAISAVESAARIISNRPAATLGEAIKVVDENFALHPAFTQGVLKFYGYTSREGGIRHSLTEASNIDETDARLALVLCSAISNFLISRSTPAL